MQKRKSTQPAPITFEGFTKALENLKVGITTDLDTKIKESEQRLSGRINGLQEDLSDVKGSVGRVEQKVDKLGYRLNHLDAAVSAVSQEHEKTLDDHEKRVLNLETLTSAK